MSAKAFVRRLQPPATAGGTDIGNHASSDPPDEADDPLAGMRTEFDARRHLIYVEDSLEDGKPRVWYKYENGSLFRYERDPLGVTRSRADAVRFGKFVKRE